MATSGVVLSPVKDDCVLSPLSIRGRDLLLSPEILIYLAFDKSMVPMRVFANDTIARVKFRIQTCGGLNVKQQRLICGGRELARNNCLVKEYGLCDGNVLHLMVRCSDLQSVTVKTVDGRTYVFQLERNRRIRDLKELIAKRHEEIDLEDQELIFRGKHLDDQRKVDDLALEDDITLHLFVRKNDAKLEAVDYGDSVVVSVDTETLAEDVNNNSSVKPKQPPWPGALLPAKPSDYHDGFFEYQRNSKPVPVPVVPKPLPKKKCILEPLTASSKHKLSATFQKMVKDVREGLESGQSPICSLEGSGGAYFMKDSSGSRHIGVFKPIDEEPMAENNPRGLPLSMNGEGLKKGTRVGEGAYREVAAYILDHPLDGPRMLASDDEPGFAGVPPTMMIRCSHSVFNYSSESERVTHEPKTGSLQQFVESFSNCEDMGPAAFTTEQVHRIAVLDMRLANADRHGGNILVCKDPDNPSAVRLVPIDHGYCLPETFEDVTFEWMYWPQAKQPLGPEALRYIESLDAEKDIALLKYHGWTLSHECARVFRISTMLLKKGAEAGLSPYEIAVIMCRESLNKPSVIEHIVDEALESVLPASSESTFMEAVSQIMDRSLPR